MKLNEINNIPAEILEKYPDFKEVLIKKAFKRTIDLRDKLARVTEEWEEEKICEECGNLLWDDKRYEEEVNRIEEKESDFSEEWAEKVIYWEKERLSFFVGWEEIGKESYSNAKKFVGEIREDEEEKQNEEIKRLTLLHGNKKIRTRVPKLISNLWKEA